MTLLYRRNKLDFYEAQAVAKMLARRGQAADGCDRRLSEPILVSHRLPWQGRFHTTHSRRDRRRHSLQLYCAGPAQPLTTMRADGHPFRWTGDPEKRLS
jgi:hypothetical protein